MEDDDFSLTVRVDGANGNGSRREEKRPLQIYIKSSLTKVCHKNEDDDGGC
jgi:hypothetical protein